jgi:RND superfamily putative drug exporter
VSVAILAVWAVLAVVGGVLGGGVYDRTETVDDARGESARVQERLDELDPEGELILAVIAGQDFLALAVADRVTETLKTIPAPEVLVGGKLLPERTFAEQATEDAVFGESIALVVLAAVLVLFLGGLVAGLLPLAAALATIAGLLLVLNALAGTGGFRRPGPGRGCGVAARHPA